MEEYKKIASVTKKIDPDAPHDVILVLGCNLWSKYYQSSGRI